MCDIVKNVAERFAKQYDIPNVFTDFHDLVVSDQVDAVAIVTPPVAHAVQRSLPSPRASMSFARSLSL